MKTNLLKLGVFSVALIAAGIMVSQTTQAATGSVTLQVTSSAGSCSYSTGVSAGTIAASFATGSVTGTFAGYFVCTGYSNTVSTLTIQSDNLSGPNSYVIGSGNVRSASLFVNTIAGDSGCQVAVSMTGDNFIVISGAQNILSRNNQGRPCTLSASGVKVAVTVPGSAPVGLYTGTLTFTESGW